MGNFDNYFYLGKVIKPHGYQGRLSVFLDTDDPDAYLATPIIYIDFDGALVPYFVKNINLMNNKAVVTFKDIDTPEQAEKLLKRDMYLPLDELPVLTGNQFYFHEIIGMKIVDKHFGFIGEITEVLHYSKQAIIQTFHNEKEVLIPISDEIILEVDRENNSIQVELPDGLLALYLDE
ncbi:MAG: 16S rRNA processing protein RimM [Bacteroidetes bacterium CG18_big_fil_WC_8_21_14_2_50_41_14]|nr:MAG: 16S rRNA processing protein RimM [Bacteroidetes bacterium CG18_big_fil_WC_8_21_14_2_50_41_14]